ncbi:MAG: hypothetical protein ACFFDY_10725, partial [Candidatus Thorarchaeota archaeon]
MSSFEWNKVDFQQFINKFGKKVVINNAPIILYSKKDKEHEAYNSLIAFFFIAGALLIYTALTYLLATFFFSLVLFILIIIIGVIADILLIINIIKSNVYIKPLECWIEIFKASVNEGSGYYCFVYYPIFTGKCHPNEAKNVIFKMFLEQVIKSKVDITQIEIYLKESGQNQSNLEKIGFFFQYAEGRPFRDESINRNNWKYFSSDKSDNENYLAVGNWDHQYEWRYDLDFDFDKLHEYAPWVIQKWNELNLKPLTEEFKNKMNWNLRNIDSTPKLNPSKGNFENQAYENQNAYKDLELVEEAINKIIQSNKNIEK